MCGRDKGARDCHENEITWSRRRSPRSRHEAVEGDLAADAVPARFRNRRVGTRVAGVPDDAGRARRTRWVVA